jgi:hypothetical protein
MMIDLWRYLEDGVIPDGAVLRPTKAPIAGAPPRAA